MARADTGTRGTAGTMPLNKVLDMVRKLIAQAEHPNTDPAEAQRYRAQADTLMLTYSIKEIQAEQARPVGERQKPGIIRVMLTGDYEMLGWLASLADYVARHCHCKVRQYAGYDREEHCYFSKVYGFESDLRYFEILYTTLRLHMLGALLPQVDANLSLEDNCYRLHQAGYNWLQIAELYGWRKIRYSEAYHAGQGDTKVPYRHRETQEIQPATTVGGLYKRAYLRAVKARSEHATQIPASGSKTFRNSAAQGYVTRINRRLRDVAGARQAGAELVLRSRTDDLDALFRADNPEMFREQEKRAECEACKRAKSGHCRSHPAGRAWKPAPFSPNGYATGVNHANSADLGAKVGGDTRIALG